MAISITTTTLPNSVVGQTYRFQLQCVVSPASPVTWSCTNALPGGLALDAATGILSGVCGSAFFSSLTFYVKSNNSGQTSAPKIFTPVVAAGWSAALMRDNLQDTGTFPRPAMPSCVSPDIVCTQDTLINPVTFTQNYATDPNLPLVPGQNNNVYVRVKNTGSSSGAGAVYLYTYPSSLLALPSQWTGNSVPLADNIFSQTNSTGIAVTQTPFSWTPAALPAGQQYAMVSAVSMAGRTWDPSSIPAFADWGAYVTWVNNNPNICFRNVTINTALTQAAFTRLDLLNYPFQTPVPMLVQAQLTNVPLNTTVTLKNDALGITNTQKVTSVDQAVYSVGATCPANFMGYIETAAQLPSGQSWPVGAQIATTLYFGVAPTAKVAAYAREFKRDAKHPSVRQIKQLIGATGPGQLVPVGNCTTVMQAAV